MATAADKRAWLKDNGYNVSARGRLAPKLELAYAEAHPDDFDVEDLAPPSPADVEDQVLEDVSAAEEPADVRDELPPVRPTRRRQAASRPGRGVTGWLSRAFGDGQDSNAKGKGKAKAKPKLPRVPLDRFVGHAYLRLGQLASSVAPATGRCLQAQSAMAGVILEDVARNTAVDKLLQPVARAEDKLDKVFALAAPPIIVFALETGDPENMVRRTLLTGLLKESLLISMDVTQQYADKIERMAQRNAENEAAIDQLISFIFGQTPAPGQPQAEREPEMAAA